MNTAKTLTRKITMLSCSLFMLAGCAHQKPASAPTTEPEMSMAKNDAQLGAIGDRCTTDSQCRAGLACLGGRCVDRAQELASCTNVKVHFEYDSSEIPQAERAQLERAADCLKSSRATKVKIEGNTDERGTEEYNMALGDRRAVSVASYLEKLGATQDQVQTISYGKGDPICQQHDETCWSQNRRAAVKPENK
jgi:peptidoglycan-associated lipoprotein